MASGLCFAQSALLAAIVSQESEDEYIAFASTSKTAHHGAGSCGEGGERRGKAQPSSNTLLKQLTTLDRTPHRPL